MGAIVLRGRFPGCTRLAMGTPSGPTGSAEKSVSWLLRMKPSTKWNEPNDDSTVVVNDAALPSASTMLTWLVPCSGTGGAGDAGPVGRREMAAKIRLARVGSKKNPIYRVVAADSRAPRDGKFLDIVGRYNPQTDPSTVDLDEGKVKDWLGKGAQPVRR